jgi:hypothetical protein
MPTKTDPERRHSMLIVFFKDFLANLKSQVHDNDIVVDEVGDSLPDIVQLGHFHE